MPTTIFMTIMAVVFLLLSVTFASAWVYKDAKQKGLQAGLWALLVVLSGNFIGLILYLLIGRKQERRACQHCGVATSTQGTFCSACGKENTASNSITQANKGLLFACIACIALAFIAFLLCFYSAFASDGFAFERQFSAYHYGPNGSSKNVSQKSSGSTWELSYNEASGGYTFEKTYNAGTEPLSLSVSIRCSGSVQLIVTQNGTSINKTLMEGSFIFDMTGFSPGKINVKIVNIDASDFSSTLEITRTEASR